MSKITQGVYKMKMSDIEKAASELLHGDYIFRPADEKRYCAKCKNEIRYSYFESECYLVECEHCKTRTLVHARSPLEAVDTVGIKESVNKTSREKYRPFESIEEAREIINKHGGWISYLDKRDDEMIVFVDRYNITAGRMGAGCFSFSYKEMFYNFVFTDDGSPCGMEE